ncbi:MAG: hypothetical protein ABIZ50_00070 [Solirubrobacterales bacterium]
MPRTAREAMLRGIDDNTIIVGAYSDPGSGGICPMLAAHRNGGRTDLASFARSWDRYTDARRPRLATGREVRTLRSLLELSLVAEDGPLDSLAEIAREIRAERADHAVAVEAEATKATVPRPTGERNRAPELRHKPFWSWILPARSLEVYRERIAAASEQASEQRAAAILDGERPGSERSADERELIGVND